MKSSPILAFISLISVSCEKQTDQNDFASHKNVQPYKLSKSRKVDIQQFHENKVPIVVTRDLTIYNRTKESFWIFGKSLDEAHVQVLTRETEDHSWDYPVMGCKVGDYFKVDPDKSFVARITLPEE